MKINLVGGTNEEWARPFDSQRTINLYPVIDQQGREVSALYGTPGLLVFADVEVGQVRGLYYAANNRAFAVIGSNFYEITSGGTYTLRGGMANSTGAVTIADNGFELAVCDGINLFMFNYDTNAFAKVTDSDLPEVSTVCFIDGYFVVSKRNSQAFYISGQYSGTNWVPLDFASAESRPDKLVAVFAALGQLWLFGQTSTELYTNTGSSAFPFEKVQGATISYGALSPYSIVKISETVIWLGRGEDGQGVVYQTTALNPTPISTTPIELAIKKANLPEEIKAYSYEEDNHSFYVLTGGGLETTLVYDLKTQIWHERSFFNSYGVHEPHLACCHMFAFGKHIVGDRRLGKLYVMSSDYYSDDGEEICSERIYTHLSDEGKQIRFNKLEILLEQGVGLQSGQGSDPMIMMRISRDGGRTWGDEMSASMGKIGEYRKKVEFRRLGVSDVMTFRIRITDPVKRAIIGSYLS